MALGLLAALTPAPAGAQATDFRFGVQGSFALTGAASMKDADGEEAFDAFLSSGFGAAATFEWGLGQRSSLRARLEYLTFGDKTKEVEFDDGLRSLFRLNYDMKLIGLAADYVHSFGSRSEGAYAFGGAGWYKADGGGGLYHMLIMPLPEDHQLEMVGTASMDGSGSSMGLSLGAGYSFSRAFACELKYTHLLGLEQTIKYVGGASNAYEEDQKLDLGWLQVSFSYRF